MAKRCVCPHCGKPNDSGLFFCSTCGAPIGFDDDAKDFVALANEPVPGKRKRARIDGIPFALIVVLTIVGLFCLYELLLRPKAQPANMTSGSQVQESEARGSSVGNSFDIACIQGFWGSKPLGNGAYDEVLVVKKDEIYVARGNGNVQKAIPVVSRNQCEYCPNGIEGSNGRPGWLIHGLDCFLYDNDQRTLYKVDAYKDEPSLQDDSPYVRLENEPMWTTEVRK